MPAPIVVPMIIPHDSDSSDAKIQIELCKTLPTVKETRECLIQLQKDMDHDAAILGWSLGVVVIALIIGMIWMMRD